MKEWHYSPIVFCIGLLFTGYLATGGSTSHDAAIVSGDHPLTGAWNFKVESMQQGIFPGTLVFIESDGTIKGTISPCERPDVKRALNEVAFDEETLELSFSFVSRSFGFIAANLILAADTLDGTLNVAGMAIPFKAFRQSAE